MRILITGVHGFVGNNLVKALSTKHTLFGLDILNPARTGVVFTFNWEDLESGQLPDVDAIIHLAGKAHDTKNQSDAEVYFKINFDLTIKIFDFFCFKSGIKKFIFFSTAKAAADTVEGFLRPDSASASFSCPMSLNSASERMRLTSTSNPLDAFAPAPATASAVATSPAPAPAAPKSKCSRRKARANPTM